MFLYVRALGLLMFVGEEERLHVQFFFGGGRDLPKGCFCVVWGGEEGSGQEGKGEKGCCRSVDFLGSLYC